MDLNPGPLFVGEHILLTPPRPEIDAAIEAQWSEDPQYLAMLQSEPVRPLSAEQVRRKKRPEENRYNQFSFSIRLKHDERLIGFAELRNIQWAHGLAWVRLGIGNPQDRQLGYGTEALALLLRFAFEELNLYEMLAVVYEYNTAGIKCFEKAGFSIRVRQREAILRFGKRWDALWLSLLHEDWQKARGGNRA